MDALMPLRNWWDIEVRYLWPDRFWRGLAFRLPHTLVMWCLVRVAAHATTGRWSKTSPDDLTYTLMYDRWERPS